MKSKESTEDRSNRRSFAEHMSPTREGKVPVLHQENQMRPLEINKLSTKSHPPPRKKLLSQSPDTYRGTKEDLCRRPSLLVKSSGSPTLHATSTNRSNPARYRLYPRQKSSIPPSFSAQRIHSDTDSSEGAPQSPNPANLHQTSTHQFMRDVSNYTPSFRTSRDKVHKHKDTLSSSNSKNKTEKHRSSNKVSDLGRPSLPPSLCSRAIQQVKDSEPHSPTLSPHRQKLPPSTNCSGHRSLTPMHRAGSPRQHHRKKPTSSSTKLKSEILNGSTLKRRRESEDHEEPLGASPLLASKDSSTLKQSGKKDIQQLKSLELPSRLKSTSSSPVSFIKQLSVRLSREDVVRLLSPSGSPEERLEMSVAKNDQRREVNTFGPKLNVSKPSVSTATTQRSKIVSSASKSDSKINSGSRVKPARRRRSSVVPNDLNDLFTPDPVTLTHKTLKSDGDEKTVKSSFPEKSTEIKSSISAPASSCEKKQSCTDKVSIRPKDAKDSLSLSPTVSLERIKPEDVVFHSNVKKVKNAPVTAAAGKHHGGCEEQTAPVSNNITVDTDAVTSQQGRCSSAAKSKQSDEGDSIDMDINLDLSLALDLTQSSHSSEEEQLLSLQEMMELATKPPDTPQKGAFSEPSTPGIHRPRTSGRSKTSPPTFAKPASYKNNIDQIVQEFTSNKRTKEVEEQFLSTCRDDLLRISEYEEAQQKQEEEQPITTEQQEFLQRYTLMSTGIKEVPPGDAIFNLEKFGRIFNPDTLQLRQCMLKPQGAAQKTLLWSSPTHFRSHVVIGLFQEAYDCHSPCPTAVSLFLFKMMSVHTERLISEKILQALSDIACTAASQIVEHGNQEFKVWVPSLADVTLILMNMGAAFVSLFPFENLQPSFTEADLLEDIIIKSENCHEKEQNTFSEHNYNNILKYLSLCMGLCPRAYSDDELLLLLTVLGRVSLDTQLVLHSGVELFPLQYKLINNIRDWGATLPRMCSALTDLTDDHHNMCLLVQQLPDSKRGKELRQHLSLSMISKLIDGKCTYKPTGTEFQLSLLKKYLPSMQPSSILKGMLSSSSRSQSDAEEDMPSLDQQTFYLCYSLLTLTNEASNFYTFPAQQKEQLQSLCSKLDSCVKCDIRESEKCLYRSKVKDLVARIDIRWQMVLQKTRPLHGQLYDYWQP